MSTWLPAAPCTPQHCVDDPVALAGRPRRLGRYAAVLGVLVAGLLLAPLARLCPPGLGRWLTRAWVRAVPAVVGVRTRVVGRCAPPGGGGVLIVANHISWLDVPLVAAVRPARMLAKREVAAYPLLGGLAARGGTLFIDRDRLRSLPDVVARIAEVLRAGSAVVVFPEGSTWCGRRQGRFRPAVFQAALDAGVPVQPVLIRYRLAGAEPATAAAFVGEDTLPASLRRVAAARGLVAEVRLLPPIPAGAHPDRRSLARAAQAAVAGGNLKSSSGNGEARVHPPAPGSSPRQCTRRT